MEAVCEMARGDLAWSEFASGYVQGEGAGSLGDLLAVPSHDMGSSRSGLAGVGREAIGERDDEVAQFIGALDDERPVE